MLIYMGRQYDVKWEWQFSKIKAHAEELEKKLVQKQEESLGDPKQEQSLGDPTR